MLSSKASPLSNGRMASGVADIPTYLKMGIRVGMGIDGEASGDLADPFENMRAGLGVKDKLGSLEPGKFADFVMIDPARLGAVLEDPYANLVLVTGERDIASVYVGGDLKVYHGHMLHQDPDGVEKEVTRRVALH